MNVIAKTDKGFIIEATTKELEEIITAVQGIKPNEINIGQKIAAIDYAGMIRKIKELRDSYDFKQIFSTLKDFNRTALALQTAVNKAGEES